MDGAVAFMNYINQRQQMAQQAASSGTNSLLNLASTNIANETKQLANEARQAQATSRFLETQRTQNRQDASLDLRKSELESAHEDKINKDEAKEKELLSAAETQFQTTNSIIDIVSQDAFVSAQKKLKKMFGGDTVINEKIRKLTANVDDSNASNSIDKIMNFVENLMKENNFSSEEQQAIASLIQPLKSSAASSLKALKIQPGVRTIATMLSGKGLAVFDTPATIVSSFLDVDQQYMRALNSSKKGLNGQWSQASENKKQFLKYSVLNQGLSDESMKEKQNRIVDIKKAINLHNNEPKISFRTIFDSVKGYRESQELPPLTKALVDEGLSPEESDAASNQFMSGANE